MFIFGFLNTHKYFENLIFMTILGNFQSLLFSSSVRVRVLAAPPIPLNALMKIYNFISKGYWRCRQIPQGLCQVEINSRVKFEIMIHVWKKLKKIGCLHLEFLNTHKYFENLLFI